MATNIRKEGDVVTLIAPTGGVVTGQIVVVGDIVGVALTTEDAGDAVECKRRCEISYAKTSADAWTQGAKLYYDDTNDEVTDVAGTLSLVGRAVEAQAALATTANIILAEFAS